MNKVVFLYTEIADYFLKCLNACGSDVQFLVIHWPINKEAPFQFEIPENTKLVNKSSHSKVELQTLIAEFQPNLICCSGWIDKDYISFVRYFKSKKIKTCITFDNHWNNSLKQNIARLVSRFTIIRYFDFAWVPGETQKKYALKLGFKSNQIELGYYCADSNRFNDVYEQKLQHLNNNEFPHVFLFVARYVKHKGIFDLWHAFIKIKEEYPNDWQLWCIGTGAEWENRMMHQDIQHFGFKQPNELLPYLLQSSVYILPSHFEPWGVSAHEMALSGFPMILSNKVGSSEKFLIENLNGFSYTSGNKDQLKSQMLKMVNANNSDLIKQVNSSHNIGIKLVHKDWHNTLLRMLSIH
jgi:glycosyltransferase involved in cell wall biosynthesis